MFGAFGAQDSFSSWGSSFTTLGLLGFGKSLGYDSLVNDGLGARYDGLGMHILGFIKPVIFWVLIFLLVWVIPNIILGESSLLACRAHTSERKGLVLTTRLPVSR